MSSNAGWGSPFLSGCGCLIGLPCSSVHRGALWKIQFISTARNFFLVGFPLTRWQLTFTKDILCTQAPGRSLSMRGTRRSSNNLGRIPVSHLIYGKTKAGASPFYSHCAQLEEPRPRLPLPPHKVAPKHPQSLLWGDLDAPGVSVLLVCSVT